MIYLRKLNPKINITTKYQNWMNNQEIQMYTEQKFKKHSLNDIKKFVTLKNKSKSEFLYGIFLKKNSIFHHIGNIKLGPINLIHSNADISYFIGEKNLWGNGYTTQAIKKIIRIAKKKKIKKLKAGCYEMNYGSKKVLEKNGFVKEGTLKSEILFKKKRYCSFIYGKII